MNKALLAVLMVFLLVTPSYAAQTQKTIVDEVTISKASPLAEGNTNISEAEKVTFFVTYTSSSPTEGVTANVTASISYDGIHWQDISWFDVAGGVTPQTSETLTTNQTYVGWFDKALTAPRIRIGINMSEANAPAAVGYGAEMTATVTVKIIEKK